jgi:hypothetical protein
MAHSFDTSAKINAGTSNPQAANYTCGAGATLLVVTLIYTTGWRVGAPTYNGVELTQADGPRVFGDSAPEVRAEIWYLCGPPTEAAYSLSVPNPNSLSIEVCISSYIAGSGKQSRLEVSAGTTGSGNNPSVNITTSTNGAAIVAAVAHGHNTWAPSARAGTQLYDTDNGTWGGGHQYVLQASAGLQAMSWTFGSSDDWGLVAAAFAEVDDEAAVSKANVYGVLEPVTGISVAKAGAYGILQPPEGISVAKANAYAVLQSVSEGLNVSKACVYAVIYPLSAGGFLVGKSSLVGSNPLVCGSSLISA